MAGQMSIGQLAAGSELLLTRSLNLSLSLGDVYIVVGYIVTLSHIQKITYAIAPSRLCRYRHHINFVVCEYTLT